MLICSFCLAENNAPTFATEEVIFNLTIGEEFEYVIDASDLDNDSFTFQSEFELPRGASLNQLGNSLIFRWRVNTTQQVCSEPRLQRRLKGIWAKNRE